MNAVNPLETPPPVGNDSRSFEPSMEEILASIRRIISDDQATPKRTTPRDIPALRAETRDASPALPEPPAPVHLVQAESPSAPVPTRDEANFDGDHEEPGYGQHSSTSAHGTIAAPQYPSFGGFPQEVAPSSASLDQPEAITTVAAVPASEPAESSRIAPPPSPAPVFEADEAPPVHLSSAEEMRRAPEPAELFSERTNQSVASAFNVLAATRLADHSEELLDLAREMMRPLLRTWLDDNLPNMVERMVRAEIERVARGRR